MLRLVGVVQLISSTRNYTVKSGAHHIAKEIHSKIQITGPITVAEYMKHVLTNPLGGYYMHRDMIGESGDFITSPEINQMFGEMIAIWFLNEWTKVGSPKPLQIVELGPGRGTLSQDLLRVFSHFGALESAALNLVEVSPGLSEIQALRLCSQSENVPQKNSPVFKEGVSHYGVPVKWYRQLDDVPNRFTLLVAHEFFDALPIHKFQKTENGYREVLIDTASDKFRYIMSKEQTPACKLFVKSLESRPHFETSPETQVLVKKIADRIECDGGFALIADYGHNGEGTDTFRAFKKHKLHDPLIEPGSADLTADVNFKEVAESAVASGGVISLGPITQREFLQRMGIEHRYNNLQENATPEQRKSLTFGYNMMMEKAQMGERFKFLALIPAVLKEMIQKCPVAGFH